MMVQAASSSDAAHIVEHLGLTDVATTLDDADIQRCVSAPGDESATTDPRNQALLSCLGLHGDAEQIQAMWARHPVYSLLADPRKATWLQDDYATVNRLLQQFQAVLLGRDLKLSSVA